MTKGIGANPRGDGDAGIAGRQEPLARLAEDINTQYRQHKVYADAARRHAQSAREHLKRLSLMLLEAHERVDEDKSVEWGTWVRENLAFGERQAQRYLKLGRAHRDDPTRVSGGSLREQSASIDAPVEREKKRGGALHFSGETDEWYTPPDILRRAALAMGGIDLDPCADPGRRVKAETHYTKDDDGLLREWNGRVFMNPPYGKKKLDRWVRKLLEEYRAGRAEAAVALVPAGTDTGWFALLDDYPRCFLHGRLKFISESGDAKDAAPFASAVFYLGDDPTAFRRAFEELGKVYTESDPVRGKPLSEDLGDGGAWITRRPAPGRCFPSHPPLPGVEVDPRAVHCRAVRGTSSLRRAVPRQRGGLPVEGKVQAGGHKRHKRRDSEPLRGREDAPG